MKKLEKFNLFSGIIGLVANLIALVGFISGLVVPQPSWGFFGDPLVIAVLTLAFLVYSLVIIMFFIFRSARTSWERSSRLPNSESRRVAPMIMGYLLGAPTTLIWGFAMFKLFWKAYFGELSASDFMVRGRPLDMGFGFFMACAVIYFALVPASSGSVLADSALALVEFFNPQNQDAA